MIHSPGCHAHVRGVTRQGTGAAGVRRVMAGA